MTQETIHYQVYVKSIPKHKVKIPLKIVYGREIDLVRWFLLNDTECARLIDPHMLEDVQVAYNDEIGQISIWQEGLRFFIKPVIARKMLPPYIAANIHMEEFLHEA